ncbi:hypothetical protein QJQ45_012756 [Haematococcus lacustris]|nr:hypothetical protein QJQ45_012756 [Haematococcus lacustris]
MGDLNSHLGKLSEISDLHGWSMQHGPAKSNQAGRELIDVLSATGLVATTGRGHGDMGQRTCRASTRTEHIIMSESVYSLSHTSSFPDACHEFDHSPITLSFKAPAQATTPIHTCNADCHTGPQLQWMPDQAARYVGALIALEEEVMAVQQAVEQGTHPDSINRFVHDIISRAAGSAGMLKPRLCPLARVDKHTTVKPAWFDRSCKEAKAALWQALRSGEALHLYRARKQAYRRLVARAKSAWSKHRAAKLLDMLKHNPGDALKMLRVKHARQQSMVPIDKWHQHLQAYFTTTIAAHETPDVIPEPAWTRQAVPAHLQAVPLGRGRLHSVPAPVTTHAPTYELPHFDNITSIVEAQLRELNNDTAPGLDGVPAPFIKHARTVEEGVTTYLLLPLLATWFHSMMRTGSIPAAWKDTDPTDPNKYRMLAVSSVLYRLYANVLRHVLTAWCMTHKVLPAEQFGFIPGRSTMQPMFILRHLVHAQKASADAKHCKLYTAFIDFKQAYDHIPRQQLWEHLRVGVKLPQPLLACLEGLYRDDSYVLIDGPHRTPPVTPDQGVKQGCPISPLLFALYVHDISKEFLGPVDAVRVQGTPVTHFMYADDLTLVSTSPHGLQRLVCQLQGFADRKHLTVNVGKSKVMVFNGNSQTAAPSIGYKHEILPVVREFKYLGMHFNPSATPAFAATHMRAGMFLAMRQAMDLLKNVLQTLNAMSSAQPPAGPAPSAVAAPRAAPLSYAGALTAAPILPDVGTSATTAQFDEIQRLRQQLVGANANLQASQNEAVRIRAELAEMERLQGLQNALVSGEQTVADIRNQYSQSARPAVNGSSGTSAAKPAAAPASSGTTAPAAPVAPVAPHPLSVGQAPSSQVASPLPVSASLPRVKVPCPEKWTDQCLNTSRVAEIFCEDLEVHCAYLRIDPADALPNFLTGKAREVWYPATRNAHILAHGVRPTWSFLRTSFKEMAGDDLRNDSDVHRRKLLDPGALRMTAGSTLNAYITEFRNTLTVAGMTCMAPAMLVATFIRGLTPELQGRVVHDLALMAEPTLTDAIQAAVNGQKVLFAVSTSIGGRRPPPPVAAFVPHKQMDRIRGFTAPAGGFPPSAPRGPYWDVSSSSSSGHRGSRHSSQGGGRPPRPPPPAAPVSDAPPRPPPGHACHHCWNPAHFRDYCNLKHLSAEEARRVSGFPRPSSLGPPSGHGAGDRPPRGPGKRDRSPGKGGWKQQGGKGDRRR